MNKTQKYQSYKKLSKGIFEPIDVDVNNSPHYYRRMGKLYERCASKRIAFRDEYHATTSDSGHEKAINAAKSKSEDAFAVFRMFLKPETPDAVVDDNDYEKLKNVRPRPKRLVVTPVVNTEPKRTEVVVDVQSENHLLEVARNDSLAERLTLTSLIYSIINRHVDKKFSERPDLHSFRNAYLLPKVIWMMLANIPLNAARFIRYLKDDFFYYICVHACQTEDEFKLIIEKTARSLDNWKSSLTRGQIEFCLLCLLRRNMAYTFERDLRSISTSSLKEFNTYQRKMNDFYENGVLRGKLIM